jgi:hypothetical protein|tara:strand:+ start:30 stop:185 length:156 start_codon:yes stop_codon:yes gene_type:complete
MAKKTARQILDKIEEVHLEEQSLMKELENILFPQDLDDFEEDDFQDEEELN